MNKNSERVDSLMLLKKRKIIRSWLTLLLMCLTLFGISTYAFAENKVDDATLNRYRNMLAMLSDLDFAATNETMRDLCALLSKNAYDKDANGKWDTEIYKQLGCINTIVFSKPDVAISYLLDQYQQPIIIMTFQGSVGGGDWWDNILAWKSNNGIHQGFDDQSLDLRRQLYDYRFIDLPGQPNFIELMESTYTNGKGAHFIITGHSLGGASAQICAYDFAMRGVSKDNILVYTFASPTPFNLNEISYESSKGLYIHNYINAYDLVPAVGIGAVDILYWNGGNLGCNYYVDDGTGSVEKFATYAYLALIDKRPFSQQSIPPLNMIVEEHKITKYQSIVKRIPILVESRDFTPTKMDESIFDFAPKNLTGYTYKPNYFNRLITADGLPSMHHGYVTTYPQKDDNILEGFAEYIFNSTVSEVGVYVGDTSTSLPYMIPKKLQKNEYGEFSTEFQIDINSYCQRMGANSYHDIGWKYFQAYAVVNGKTYRGRAEQLKEKNPSVDSTVEKEPQVFVTTMEQALNGAFTGRLDYDSQYVARVGVLWGATANDLQVFGYDDLLSGHENPCVFYYPIDQLHSNSGYYQAFAEVNGKRYYGAIQEVRKIESSKTEPDVKITTHPFDLFEKNLTARVDFAGDAIITEVGMYWGTSKDDLRLVGADTISPGTLTEQYIDFYCSAESPPAELFYFRAYTVIDGKQYWGETMEGKINGAEQVLDTTPPETTKDITEQYWGTYYASEYSYITLMPNGEYVRFFTIYANMTSKASGTYVIDHGSLLMTEGAIDADFNLYYNTYTSSISDDEIVWDSSNSFDYSQARVFRRSEMSLPAKTSSNP